jgi:hypothetical protein
MMSAVLARALASLSLALVLVLVLAATACDGSEEPKQVAATCASVVNAICAAACDCGGSAGCTIADDLDPDSSIAFADQRECLSVYSLACGNPQSDIDYSSCADRLRRPECKMTAQGDAFAIPSVCQQGPVQ